MLNIIHSGVKVFGSAVLRAEPDLASIQVAVSRVEQKPDSAFAKTREEAQAVNTYLQKSGIKDYGSSRITLAEEYQWTNNENRFVGYRARIAFGIVLRELDALEGLLTGLIAAGANALSSVTFETTRLKELRAEARSRAVVAARQKADLYCKACGVSVANVLSIEDVSPEVLTGRTEGHNYREPPPVDDTGEPRTINPSAISVGAAVYIVFAFGREG